MTKEQWKAVEQKILNYPYTIAKIRADGHVLSLSMQRDKMQLVIAVYVDGKINFHWLQEDCEIRRKFFQQRKRSLLTQKDRERLKREKKSIREEIQEQATYYSYSPYWTSFTALRRHLEKTCEIITPYEEGEHADTNPDGGSVI